MAIDQLRNLMGVPRVPRPGHLQLIAPTPGLYRLRTDPDRIRDRLLRVLRRPWLAGPAWLAGPQRRRRVAVGLATDVDSQSVELHGGAPGGRVEWLLSLQFSHRSAVSPRGIMWRMTAVAPVK